MMRQIYLALKEGLPCPVARAWPQHTPALPGCVFYLKQWERHSAGTVRLVIAVTLRVNTPEQGDTYSNLADSAMRRAGLALMSARDDQEAQTGFYLKILAFEGRAARGADGTFALLPAPYALNINILIDGVKMKDADEVSTQWVTQEGRLLRQVRLCYFFMTENEAKQLLGAANKTSLALTFRDPSTAGNQSFTARCLSASAQVLYEQAGILTYGPVTLILQEV
ncbi:MAG: hypothetical protein GXZ04_06955 [Clostridiales bacterium]|nr:hypothetical protein [Clostridiales bacterium]